MRRFHPLELGILSLTSLLFVVSLYHFILDSGTFSQSLPAIASNEKEKRDAEVPGSVSEDYFHIEVPCLGDTQNKPLRVTTAAARVRILGKFCPKKVKRIEEGRVPANAEPIQKPKIKNTRNEYLATVFNTGENGGYSTDYMPVEKGENKIELKTGDGQIEIVVTRDK